MSIATTLDDQPICVPVEALSREGFARWAASAEFPRHVKIAALDDGLLIEGAVAEVPELEFAFRLPFTAGTPEGFSQWAVSDEFPPRGRLAFLQQEIYVDISPEEFNKHAFAKAEITRGIQTLVGECDLGEFYPDGTLLRNDQAGLSTEPDAMFASWESLESEKLRYEVRSGDSDEYTEAVGTPDWVLEIVSRSSIRKDKRLLRELYHRAGVVEYWLIDALGEEIDFQVLVHQPQGYEAIAPHAGGWLPSPVFGRRFRLLRHLNRAGRWRYRLETADL